MTEELQFPFNFSSCPNCGSTRRIAETVTKEEISKGKIKEGSRTAMFVMKSVVHDPDKATKLLAPQKVIVLLAVADICADCGTMYAINVEKGEGVLDIERPQQPPFGGQMPSFFGKG